MLGVWIAVIAAVGGVVSALVGPVIASNIEFSRQRDAISRDIEILRQLEPSSPARTTLERRLSLNIHQLCDRQDARDRRVFSVAQTVVLGGVVLTPSVAGIAILAVSDSVRDQTLGGTLVLISMASVIFPALGVALGGLVFHALIWLEGRALGYSLDRIGRCDQ